MGINCDLVVKNGRVYTPSGPKELDLWIREGKVIKLGGSHHAAESLNAQGSLVLPGAIDAHVHFRDPGPTYKEDWLSGSTASAAGGVTTVVDQPNTDPRTLDARSFGQKLDIARHRSVVDFCLNGGPGRLEDLVQAGAAAIGEIFTYEHNDGQLQAILEETARLGVLATVHAEDGEVLAERREELRQFHDPEIYSFARPALAEARAIEKVLAWSNRLHICHLSSRQGLDRIEQAKASGKKVSCEVAPHHLLFNTHDYRDQGPRLKMNPPLRGPEDNDALWAGLRNGSIDILASDHAPHLPEEKKDDIWEAPPGVPGVETLLPLMLFSVKRNLLSLERLVEALSSKPAQIFGLECKGSLEPGKDADLVIVNPRSTCRINSDRLHSRAEWTPYEGREAIFPQMTLVRGEVVFESELAVRPGFGRWQRRQSVFMRTGR